MRTQSTALRTVLAAAVPVGVVLSAAVVWQSTSAAFTASTSNPDNEWRAGSVVLADSDDDSALFTTTNDGALKPNSTRSRCIRVDYTGSLPADISFYVTPATTVATSLDPYLVMSVEVGEDVDDQTTVKPDCTAGFTPRSTREWVYNSLGANSAGTMADLKLHKDSGSGLPVPRLVQPNTYLTFRITYVVADDNNAQNGQSTAVFVWEARNH